MQGVLDLILDVSEKGLIKRIKVRKGEEVGKSLDCKGGLEDDVFLRIWLFLVISHL